MDIKFDYPKPSYTMFGYSYDDGFLRDHSADSLNNREKKIMIWRLKWGHKEF